MLFVFIIRITNLLCSAACNVCSMVCSSMMCSVGSMAYNIDICIICSSTIIWWVVYSMVCSMVLQYVRV